MSLIHGDLGRIEAEFQGVAPQNRLVICTGYLTEHPELQGRLYDPSRFHGHDSSALVTDLLPLEPYALHGSLDADLMAPADRGIGTVQKVLEFVQGRRNHLDEPTPDGFFDPRGKIVLYGYSAGGFNAVYACRDLDRWWYRYGVNGRPGALQHEATTPFDHAAGAKVQVDLLVTVDPCAVLYYGEGWDRHVASRVHWTQNWYQRSDPEFKGVTLFGHHVRNTLLTSHEVPGGADPAHVDMVGLTRRWAEHLIGRVL